MAETTSRRSLLGLVLLIAAVAGGSQWWFARAEARVGQEIARLAQAGDIRLVSSETCAYCAMARGWLHEQKVRFEECFIETDPACRATFDSLQAQGTPMVLVRGQAQAGFSPERVLEALRRRG